jgi:DNA-binding PadR family transcriptional regulator
MTRRKVANPLALAVLACLEERPMHPYEMGTTMRARHKDDSIKLNYGSLYTVVEALQRHGLIEAQETEREGKRPERTVFRITPTGSAELLDWLSELISVPEKEYLRFEAGLSQLPVLTPSQAVELLEIRCQHLEVDLAQRRTVHRLVTEQGVPRLFVVEHEYMTALVEAELEWTRKLVGEVKSKSLEGSELWQDFHASKSSEKGQPT